MTDHLPVSQATAPVSVRVGIISAKLPGVPPGGAEAVAAWMAQALQAHYEVTLLVGDPNLTLSGLDELFGTQLAASRVSVRVIPLPRALRFTAGLRELKQRLMVRSYYRIAAEYELLISASGEGYFPRRGIEYIHFPRVLQSPPGGSIVYRLYRWIVGLFPSDIGSFAGNLTFTNSKWTAAQIRHAHDLSPTILPPPIHFFRSLLPWASREPGFLIIGRLSVEKRVETAFEILSRVRQRGFHVHLHVIGGEDHRRYGMLIRRLARRYGDWIMFEGQVSRGRLEELIVSHRYGIHCMLEEHFGMAAAEMVRGGCVVFVPNGGGQRDIIGEPRCLYEDADEAVEKICAVLSSPEVQAELQSRLASNTALMRPDEFCRALLWHCRMFLDSEYRDGSARYLTATAADTTA